MNRTKKSRYTKYAMFATVAIAATAWAGLKPAQVKAKTDSEKSISTDITNLNKACGTSIDVSLDMSSWGGDWEKMVDDKAGQICGHAADGIAVLCKDAAYKPAVGEKIKKISCSCDGTTDSADKNVSLSGGVLSYKMNIKHDNSVMLDMQHWVAKELNK
jgi:hypothetical protein